MQQIKLTYLQYLNFEALYCIAIFNTLRYLHSITIKFASCCNIEVKHLRYMYVHPVCIVEEVQCHYIAMRFSNWIIEAEIHNINAIHPNISLIQLLCYSLSQHHFMFVLSVIPQCRQDSDLSLFVTYRQVGYLFQLI